MINSHLSRAITTPLALVNRNGYLRAAANVATHMGGGETTSVKALRLPERELTYLDHDDIACLAAAIREARNKDLMLIFWLCLKTGARWNEA
ncbi:hypothetical protein [Chromohalobacter israelensis]|uniref:hypothetical protein n=1 Tax=Chromohalobacter israelensis TaxID=141390 RepID=UPI000FFE4A72|nr:hypothetical protein [Chromohalobacter salexigens]RXE47607.1 hypothetical protein B4O83_06230 [Chromohalobacter salexigens]